MLVITGGGTGGGTACAQSHYDSTLQCAKPLGATPSIDGIDGCWKSDRSHQKFIDRMMQQLDSFINDAAPARGTRPFQAQALWQEDGLGRVGTLRNSSLLRDELSRLQPHSRRAGTEEAVARRQLGYLEVNNVCDGGPQLLHALQQAYYAPIRLTGARNGRTWRSCLA